MKEQEQVNALLREINQKYPSCGFYIGDGWFPIVADALRKMSLLDIKWRLDQVKQKFCGLRIYYSFVNREDYENKREVYDQMKEIVKQAQELCAEMCEFCGELHGLEIPKSGLALCKECDRKERERCDRILNKGV